MQDGIIRKPFKWCARMLPNHPLIHGVVQKQVRQ
jgi:hypothetical protein